MEQIVIFGDSIALGSWDFEHEGWANRLRKHLEQEKGTKYTIENLSATGETTKWVLERLERDLESTSPDIIIFSLGLNDSVFLEKEKKNIVEIQEFSKNLEKMIEISKKYTDKIVFIGITKINEKINQIAEKDGESYKNQIIKQYNQIIKSFAENNNHIHIDIFDEINEEHLYDYIHPNSQGHKKMFEKIRDNLLYLS